MHVHTFDVVSATGLAEAYGAEALELLLSELYTAVEAHQHDADKAQLLKALEASFDMLADKRHPNTA